MEMAKKNDEIFGTHAVTREACRELMERIGNITKPDITVEIGGAILVPHSEYIRAALGNDFKSTQTFAEDSLDPEAFYEFMLFIYQLHFDPRNPMKVEAKYAFGMLKAAEYYSFMEAHRIIRLQIVEDLNDQSALIFSENAFLYRNHLEGEKLLAIILGYVIWGYPSSKKVNGYIRELCSGTLIMATPVAGLVNVEATVGVLRGRLRMEIRKDLCPFYSEDLWTNWMSCYDECPEVVVVVNEIHKVCQMTLLTMEKGAPEADKYQEEVQKLEFGPGSVAVRLEQLDHPGAEVKDVRSTVFIGLAYDSVLPEGSVCVGKLRSGVEEIKSLLKLSQSMKDPTGLPCAGRMFLKFE